MNKPKEQIVAWMVFSSSGLPLFYTCRPTLRESIAEFHLGCTASWRFYYRMGYSCKKVIILTVPRSKRGVKIRMEYEK